MADKLTFTSKLAGTLGMTTIAGAATSTKDLDTTSAAQTGVDIVQQTLTSTCAATTFHGTPVELDMGDVWKTYGHAIHLRNTSASTTNEPAIMVATRAGVTVASGAIAPYAWYLVSGDTITYAGVTYAIGEVFQGVAGTATFTGSGVANLMVGVGKMFPGDPLGPIRRGGFTAGGTGALYHWIFNSTADLTCPMEIVAAEADDPTS